MPLLKLGLRPWKLAFWSQALSSAVVAVLLLVAGLLSWLDRGLEPILVRMDGEQVITAYLNPELDEKAEKAAVDRIRVSVGAESLEADAVRVVAPEAFVKELKEGKYEDLARELEDLGGEMGQVVPRYVSVTGVLPTDAVEKVRAVPGVESAETSRDRYAQIVGAFATLRWANRALIAGLLLALATGLAHLGRVNGQIHREALALLRLWGAGPVALRVPGLVTGLTVGLVGGGAAALLWGTFGMDFAAQIRGITPMLGGLPAPSLAPAALLAAAGTILGLCTGVAGSRG